MFLAFPRGAWENLSAGVAWVGKYSNHEQEMVMHSNDTSRKIARNLPHLRLSRQEQLVTSKGPPGGEGGGGCPAAVAPCSLDEVGALSGEENRLSGRWYPASASWERRRSCTHVRR